MASVSIVGDEHERAGRGQRTARSVDDAGARGRLLARVTVDAIFCGAGELTIPLDQQGHAIHATVIERQAPAVGIDRESTAGRRAPRAPPSTAYVLLRAG